MTHFSFIQCCHLLAIDPKTLRQWLAQAQISLSPHPKDARIKCLTSEQVQTLARLHSRVLQEPIEGLVPASSSARSNEIPGGADISGADLRARLAQLEAQVTTLQAQLTDLALHLLKAREQRTEQRLLALEAQLPRAGEPLPPPSARSLSSEQALPSVARPSFRQRTRLIPLIEYGAGGQYVLICPKEGERHILPDSPEWFAWLETFNSFRFIGQQGRLSTYRNPGRSCWMAYRRIHGHRYEYALGHTERLTIDRLEQMAATLQSHAPTR
jgi:hypothetical protein